MIEERVGDLFESGLPALGHGCNAKGVMGAGIAAQFSKRFPAMYEGYRELCKGNELQLGDIFFWDDTPLVYNLITQVWPGADARLDAVTESVRDMLEDVGKLGHDAVGIPRIGAGIGGLDWEEVLASLHQVADDSPVNLVVYTLPE